MAKMPVTFNITFELQALGSMDEEDYMEDNSDAFAELRQNAMADLSNSLPNGWVVIDVEHIKKANVDPF